MSALVPLTRPQVQVTNDVNIQKSRDEVMGHRTTISNALQGVEQPPTELEESAAKYTKCVDYHHFSSRANLSDSALVEAYRRLDKLKSRSIPERKVAGKTLSEDLADVLRECQVAYQAFMVRGPACAERLSD